MYDKDVEEITPIAERYILAEAVTRKLLVNRELVQGMSRIAKDIEIGRYRKSSFFLQREMIQRTRDVSEHLNKKHSYWGRTYLEKGVPQADAKFMMQSDIYLRAIMGEKTFSEKRTEEEKVRAFDKGYRNVDNPKFTRDQVAQFSAVLQAESLHQDSYVFYHATKNANGFLYEIFTEFRKQLELNYSEETQYFRALDNFFNYNSVKEFISASTVNGTIKDYTGNYDETVLSVNLFLFGSTGKPLCESYRMFLDNESVCSPNTEKLFYYFVRSLGFNVDFSVFEALLKRYWKSTGGALYQIFVDKSSVDEIGYPAKSYGPLAPLTTDDGKEVSNLSEVIEALKMKPECYRQYIIESEGRLYLHPKILHDPEKVKIKMYQANPMSQEDRVEYRTRLSQIVRSCIVEILARRMSMPKDKLIKGQPKLQKIVSNVFKDDARINFDNEEDSGELLPLLIEGEKVDDIVTLIVKADDLDLERVFPCRDYFQGESEKKSLIDAFKSNLQIAMQVYVQLLNLQNKTANVKRALISLNKLDVQYLYACELLKNNDVDGFIALLHDGNLDFHHVARELKLPVLYHYFDDNIKIAFRVYTALAQRCGENENINRTLVEFKDLGLEYYHAAILIDKGCVQEVVDFIKSANTFDYTANKKILSFQSMKDLFNRNSELMVKVYISLQSYDKKLQNIKEALVALGSLFCAYVEKLSNENKVDELVDLFMDIARLDSFSRHSIFRDNSLEALLKRSPKVSTKVFLHLNNRESECAGAQGVFRWFAPVISSYLSNLVKTNNVTEFIDFLKNANGLNLALPLAQQSFECNSERKQMFFSIPYNDWLGSGWSHMEVLSVFYMELFDRRNEVAGVVNAIAVFNAKNVQYYCMRKLLDDGCVERLVELIENIDNLDFTKELPELGCMSLVKRFSYFPSVAFRLYSKLLQNQNQNGSVENALLALGSVDFQYLMVNFFMNRGDVDGLVGFIESADAPALFNDNSWFERKELLMQCISKNPKVLYDLYCKLKRLQSKNPKVNDTICFIRMTLCELVSKFEDRIRRKSNEATFAVIDLIDDDDFLYSVKDRVSSLKMDICFVSKFHSECNGDMFEYIGMSAMCPGIDFSWMSDDSDDSDEADSVNGTVAKL